MTREKGKIALATSFDEQSPSFLQRLDGFIEELDEGYPQIEIVNRDSNIVFQKGEYSNVLEVVKKNDGFRRAVYHQPG